MAHLFKSYLRMSLAFGAVIAGVVVVGGIAYLANGNRSQPKGNFLQDQLKQAGYVVVQGDGADCKPAVQPESKTIVVCGE